MSFPNLDDEINDVHNITNSATNVNNIITQLKDGVSTIDDMKTIIDDGKRLYSELNEIKITEHVDFDIDLFTQFIETGKFTLSTLNENIKDIPNLLNDLKQKSTITDTLTNDIQSLVENVGDLSNTVINMKTNIDDSLTSYQKIQQTILDINFDDFKLAQDRVVQVKNMIEQIGQTVRLLPETSMVVDEINKVHGFDFATKFKTLLLKIDIVLQSIDKLSQSIDDLNHIVLLVPQLLNKLKSFDDVLNNLAQSSDIFKQLEEFVKLVEQFELLQKLLEQMSEPIDTINEIYGKLQTIELPSLEDIKKIMNELESELNKLTKLNIDDIINNIVDMLSKFDFEMVDFIPTDSINTIIRWIIFLVLLILIIPIALNVLFK